MIVVDVNLVAYAVLPGERTQQALTLLARDPEWVAPVLWQSELRNVLATTMRVRGLRYEVALGAWARARDLVVDSPTPSDTARVLRLAAESRASAYDCEYVALAESLAVPFVTSDVRLARRVPRVARHVGDFLGEG
jgi:predicted nucleic acid-binding protein